MAKLNTLTSRRGKLRLSSRLRVGDGPCVRSQRPWALVNGGCNKSSTPTWAYPLAPGAGWPGFTTAYANCGGGMNLTGADLAAACGFYDQSHLVNEFRAFCGVTPSEFWGRDVSASSKTSASSPGTTASS